MFSHIIIFGSSLPEALGGQSLYAIICERVLIERVTSGREGCRHRGVRSRFAEGFSVTG